MLPCHGVSVICCRHCLTVTWTPPATFKWPIAWSGATTMDLYLSLCLFLCLFTCLFVCVSCLPSCVSLKKARCLVWKEEGSWYWCCSSLSVYLSVSLSVCELYCVLFQKSFGFTQGVGAFARAPREAAARSNGVSRALSTCCLARRSRGRALVAHVAFFSHKYK